MSGFQLGGLASGLDTNTIISQLMAIERKPELLLQIHQHQIQARQSGLRDVATRLQSLKFAAADLGSVGLWQDTQTVSSSDDTKVSAQRTASAGPTDYSVDVTSLARAEQRTYSYTADPSNPTTLTIDGVDVAVAAGTSGQGLVDAINTTTGITVYANLDSSGRILLTHRATGASSIAVSGTTSMAEVAGTAKLGSDAVFSIDGGAAQSRSTNVVTDAIPGLTLTLKNTTAAGSPVTIGVGAPGPDTKAVVDKVKAFIDQYNSTTDFLRGKVGEQRVVNPQTDADYTKGMLSSDSMLEDVLDRLRNAFTNPVAGNPSAMDELSEIGISTGATTGGGALNADAVSGKLVLDEGKLTAALASDPRSVRALLGGVFGTEGLAQRIQGVIDPETTAGGLIDTRVQSADSELSDIRNQLSEMDSRLASKESLLRAQFSAMESAFAASQQQTGFLSRQAG